MKILQLCHKPPFPATDGGTLAMHANTLAMQELGHEIHIVTFETPKHPVDWAQVSDEYITKHHYKVIYKDTTPTSTGTLLAYFTGDNYLISRFKSDEIVTYLNSKKAEQYDVIWFESLFSTAFHNDVKNAFPDAKLIYRAHNIEFQLWRGRLNEYNPIKRVILKKLTERLEKYEKELISTFDASIAISQKDESWIKHHSNKPTAVLPYFNWKSDHKSTADFKSNPLKFLFLGSLDWEPNLTGIKWLIQQVWPSVKQKLPEAELHIAGRNMPEDLKVVTNGVSYRGQIEDVVDYYQEGEIVLVPVFSGSGIRIKIIEALSYQKAVITTDIGLSGLNFTANQDVKLANTTQEFVDAMIQLATDSVERNQFQELGFHAYQKKYSKQAYLETLNHFLNQFEE